MAETHLEWQPDMADVREVALQKPSNVLDRKHKQLTAEQKNEIAFRLSATLERANDKHVIKAAEIAPRSLHRYKNGGLPDLASLMAIADACGVSIEWLLTGRGEQRSNWITTRHPTHDNELGEDEAVAFGPVMPLPGGDRRQYVPIPRLNIQASAGGGALVEHAQVVEYFAFDADFVRTRLRRDPKHLVLIEARGDSMEPTIRDGDILTVDISPDQTLQSSTLYVIRIEEALMVKRLDRRIDGSIIVHSDNPRYPPETVSRDLRAELHILGPVILVSAPPR